MSYVPIHCALHLARMAFPHLQLEQFLLHEHFTSSLHALETSSIVIHTGIHDFESLVQPNPSGEGMPANTSLIYNLFNMLE